MTKDTHKPIHHGRNVRRIREQKLIKQEIFTSMLGEGWSVKRLAQVENTAEIEPALIEELANALQVTPDAIKHSVDENRTDNSQHYYDTSSNNHSNYYYNCTVDGSWQQLQAQLKEQEKKIGSLEKLLGKKKKK